MNRKDIYMENNPVNSNSERMEMKDEVKVQVVRKNPNIDLFSLFQPVIIETSEVDNLDIKDYTEYEF